MQAQPKKTLGLIGFGQFGALAARHLVGCFDVLVHDKRDVADEVASLGAAFGSLEDAASRDIVVVAVPVPVMRDALIAMAPHLLPGALVIDVGSVKVKPAQWMMELLPEHVDIIATHPLFGPQSAKHGLKDLPFVICPVRGERHLEIAELARGAQMKVSITTPEEHDKEMAYVQALTHLIGRSLVGMKIPDEELKTRSYQHLLDLCGLIGEDTFELFTAIQTDNPYAREVAEAFVKEAAYLLTAVHAPRDHVFRKA